VPAAPSLRWRGFAGPMHPSRPVVRRDSSHMLLIKSQTAQQDPSRPKVDKSHSLNLPALVTDWPFSADGIYFVKHIQLCSYVSGICRIPSNQLVVLKLKVISVDHSSMSVARPSQTFPFRSGWPQMSNCTGLASHPWWLENERNQTVTIPRSGEQLCEMGGQPREGQLYGSASSESCFPGLVVSTLLDYRA
jgi:hypothetical protein